MVKQEASDMLTTQTYRKFFDISVDSLVDLIEKYLNRKFAEDIEVIKEFTLERYESSLKTNLNKGLSNMSDFSNRIAAFGSNKAKEVKYKTFCDICWNTMKDKIIFFLVFLGIISLIVGVKSDEKYDWVEGFSILLIVAIIVIAKGTVGSQKVKNFRKLQEMHRNRAAIIVMRDGEKSLIHPEEILVGDKVFLDTGDLIPADGIVLQATSLLTNEALLTGENDLMHKDVLKNCIEEKRKYKKSIKKNSLLKEKNHILPSPVLVSGTNIAQGNAWMLVVAVGMNSKQGRILDLTEQEQEGTPLEKKLDVYANRVAIIGVSVGLLVLIALYIRFYVQLAQGIHIWSGNESANELIGYTFLATTIIIVATPKGLPIALTFYLSYSATKMLKDNDLVKKLAACEAMGGVDSICSDKTGTLTQNMMVLKRFACAVSKSEFARHDEEHLSELFSRSVNFFETLKEGISLCTAARVGVKNGKEVDVGAQTELATIKMLRKLSKTPDEYLKIRSEMQESILKTNPFNSERKKSSIIIARPDGKMRVYVIGAPEFIVKFCETSLDLDMNIHKLRRADIKNFLRVQEEMGSLGLKTLSIAFRDFDEEHLVEAVNENNHPILENEKLTILGLFGIQDPVRPGVKEAVEQSRLAGIKVRMVTGDNAATAEAIAIEVGITTSNEHVIEGALFNYLVGGVMCEKCEDKQDIKDPRIKAKKEENDFEKKICNCPRKGDGVRNDIIVNFDKFKEIIDKIDVVARCAPEHKYTIVTGLKQMDRVVAVTGDGTSDAPALRKANVGFAMGIAGTEYARQAADIILVDDNFGSIIKAAIWGRGIYDNIQKSIQFQITVNLVAVICCAVGAITIQQSPLTAVQLLWINMIMGLLATLALSSEEPTAEVLKRPPQNANEFIISPLMFKHIFGQAIVQIFLIFLYMYYGEFFLPEYEENDYTCTNPKARDYVCSGRLYKVDGGEDYRSALTYLGPSRHFTYIFNIFIWFQLFNEFNSRKIRDEIFVFEGLKRSRLLLFVWFITAGIQILIIQVGYRAFSVNKKGLSVEQWFICIAWGVTPLFWRFVLLVPGYGKIKLNDPPHSDQHHANLRNSSHKDYSPSYQMV